MIYIYSSSNTIQRTLQTLHIPLTPYAQAYLNIFNGFLLQLFRAPHTASSSYVGPACPSHAKFPSTGYALKLRLIRPSCVLHPSIILTSQLELTSIIQVFMSTIQSPELASHTQSLRHVVHVLTHTITHAIRLLCFQLLCTLLPFIVASTTLTKIPPRPPHPSRTQTQWSSFRPPLPLISPTSPAWRRRRPPLLSDPSKGKPYFSSAPPCNTSVTHSARLPKALASIPTASTGLVIALAETRRRQPYLYNYTLHYVFHA